MNPDEIEFWENEYLKQISYLLTLDRNKMFEGFGTKEDIRGDWKKFWSSGHSEIDRGTERIFYWLFNQFGKPNSAPVGSDLFFETYNAFVHIDVKTVYSGNIGDFIGSIFVGDNQNSYDGKIVVRGKESRDYIGNLPNYYTKADGSKKICLTYFLVTLFDDSYSGLLIMLLMCMPNGELYDTYGDAVLKAGKNTGLIRYDYAAAPVFNLLERKPSRVKVIYWDDENIDNDENIEGKIKMKLMELKKFK